MEINTIHNMDCLQGLKQLPDASIDLVVTSPPYYNAREYSQWPTLSDYMKDMTSIFSEVYRTLGNHRHIVINVGDISSRISSDRQSSQKIPLGAMFITTLMNIGFQFVDDYIWDKGEPQTKRHLGNPEYPFYQYPINCYEHIIVMIKHQIDKELIPCPSCGEKIAVSNGQLGLGVQSWECKNPTCPDKSEAGRGKRFSKRSIMMTDYQTQDNHIDPSFIKKWRRDIVRINPVIKINCNGKNIHGHSAPFPEDIPEMAIRYFSGVGDLVVDPFSGSGTTSIVAKRLSRNYIGFDIHNEFVIESLQKLSAITSSIHNECTKYEVAHLSSYFESE